MKPKLTVVGLNELNFDYVRYYIDQGYLKNLKILFEKYGVLETTSEQEYELLEPWIQWVTVHTGKTYAEHQIFRLGDITGRKDLVQIFEKVEKTGKSVGAISPFNVDNRLKEPAFFIPDPWTETKASGSNFMKKLSSSVDRLVNNNARAKMAIKDLMNLGIALLKYVPVSRYWSYFKLLLNPKRPGHKAVILDKLLSDVFIASMKKYRPDFSWLFLNSGAHIQHHYLFNSAPYQGECKNPEWYCPSGYDPLLLVLEEYDDLIGRLMAKKHKIIILTGLHQQAHEKMTFYWRLKTHKKFMRQVGIDSFVKLLPRMSRDFLVEFENEKDAARAQEILKSFESVKDQLRIFNVDNRGTSLFVELTYPNDIDDNFSIQSTTDSIQVDHFKAHVAFVAIKNGEHNGIGYVTSNFDLKMPPKIPLTKMHDVILESVDSSTYNLSYVK